MYRDMAEQYINNLYWLSTQLYRHSFPVSFDSHAIIKL